jgi:hypothetical protein
MSLNSYAYCQNNPLKYVDVNGHFVDTAIDLVSVGLSTVNMIQDPSVSNFIFLAWDIGAAALPFIPGSYVKKLGKLAGKVDDVVDLKNGKYLDDVIEGTGNLTNKISKSDLYSNYKKVEDKLKVLKDPNGNYARRAKELGYDNFNMDSWKKGIQSFKSADGLRIEYHFVKNIDDGTVIGEKIFKVIDGTREYLDILP